MALLSPLLKVGLYSQERKIHRPTSLQRKSYDYYGRFLSMQFPLDPKITFFSRRFLYIAETPKFLSGFFAHNGLLSAAVQQRHRRSSISSFLFSP